MKNLILTLFLTASTLLYGQSFVQPVELIDIMSPGFMKSAKVVQNDGNEINVDKFKSATLTNGSISSFSILAESGEKLKFKAADVKLLRVELTGLSKILFSANPEEMADKFADLIMKVELDRAYVIYEQVEVKEGKFKLMQLLNPGFDQNIKVYLDPTADQTGSGTDKSFFVQKGGRFFKLKKKKYDDEYPNLFVDCEPMMKDVGSKDFKPKLKNFPGHIAVYNGCKGK